MPSAAKFFAALALIVAMGGLLYHMMANPESAPQQAAVAAMVLAWVVPFYVIARCFEMMAGKDGAK